MAGQSTAKSQGRGKRAAKADESGFDRELEDLPPDLRWREWMMRAEAVIFASAVPVDRDALARVVGKDCSIDLLIDDLREELHGRPYELVSIGGGWQHRTRASYARMIQASSAPTRSAAAALSQHEAMVLMAVGYFQPVTRSELSAMFGKDVSRDTIAGLRDAQFIAPGPRSPTPGAPYTYITTPFFLSAFGFDTLRDLPDIEMLEDAGLLNRKSVTAEMMGVVSADDDEED